MDIGNNISIDFILNIPEEFIEDGELSIGKQQISSYYQFYKKIIKNRGLDTGPLRSLLYDNLDEKKILSSGHDLGVVTYNLTDMKPREVFIEEMERGAVLEYLLASAAFPGFKSPEIARNQYIDGGVYNNIPYAMARKRGYRNIIVVDISGVGFNKKIEIQGSQTIYIKSSIKMGGVLDFNREFLDDFLKLGYLDTMRTFEMLHGYNYFITEDIHMESRFTEFISSLDPAEIGPAPDAEDRKEQPPVFHIRGLLPEKMKYDLRLLLVLLDCAATVLDIPRIEQYDCRQLLTAVAEKKSAIENRISDFSRGGSSESAGHPHMRVEVILKEAFEKMSFNEPAYYYHLLMRQILPEKTPAILKNGMNRFFSELTAACFFFRIMDRFVKEL